MATKRSRKVTYLKGLLSIKSHNALVMWSRKVTRDKQKPLYLYQQECLWQPNLVEWWLTLMGSYLQCYLTLYHVTLWDMRFQYRRRFSMEVRLRVTQKLLQLPLFSSFFSAALLERLAKVIFKFFSNCYFKHKWPESGLSIWYAVCFQTMSFKVNSNHRLKGEHLKSSSSTTENIISPLPQRLWPPNLAG